MCAPHKPVVLLPFVEEDRGEVAGRAQDVENTGKDAGRAACDHLADFTWTVNGC